MHAKKAIDDLMAVIEQHEARCTVLELPALHPWRLHEPARVQIANFRRVAHAKELGLFLNRSRS
jgi:hypothetical protein